MSAGFRAFMNPGVLRDLYGMGREVAYARGRGGVGYAGMAGRRLLGWAAGMDFNAARAYSRGTAGILPGSLNYGRMAARSGALLGTGYLGYRASGGRANMVPAAGLGLGAVGAVSLLRRGRVAQARAYFSEGAARSRALRRAGQMPLPFG